MEKKVTVSAPCRITVHCLVKNEERFLWYSVMSILPYVDEILLWDTGSTDGTVKIIEELRRVSNKVKTKFVGSVTSESFAQVRQEMLNETTGDWLLMVDGDEIWWDQEISQVVEFIRGKGENYESLVVPTINMVGDMYHFLEEKAGGYRLAGRRGHYALRAINMSIPGLSSSNPHGTWGWVDERGGMVQNRDQGKIKFLNTPYLHASFLRRSSEDKFVIKRARKLKYEIGEKFPKDYYYPEVFFRSKPEMVQDVWETIDGKYKIRALWQTPLKKVKRRILPAKVGY